jgi:transcriptional regulator with XRE-family HTH domain
VQVQSRLVISLLVGAARLVASEIRGTRAMGTARVYGPNVRLREHRLRHSLTLEEVAEALISLAWERFAIRVGVNAGMVGKWERGEKRPSRFYQRLLALLYRVPEEQLGFRPAVADDQVDEATQLDLGPGARFPSSLDSAALARLARPSVPRCLDALIPKRSAGWAPSSPSTPRWITCSARRTCSRSRPCI